MEHSGKEEVVVFDSQLLARAFRRARESKAQKLRQFQQMAEDGIASAQCAVGLYYAMGANGYPKDMDKAMELLEAAWEQDDPNAGTVLGLCYRAQAEEATDGVERERLLRLGFECFAQEAEEGRANALFYLGLAYENGSGVGRDPEKAVECYEAASEGGNVSALTALGVCHFSGIGMARDVEGAVKLLEEAAAKGEARGQCILGDIYLNGTGVARNAARAADLYEAAMGKRYPRAYASMGVVYANGTGRKRDLGKAIELMKKSAEMGFQPAEECLPPLIALAEMLEKYGEEDLPETN